MCDEQVLSVQDNPMSVAAKVPRIKLQRAEEIFPACKELLVSVFFYFCAWTIILSPWLPAVSVNIIAMFSQIGKQVHVFIWLCDWCLYITKDQNYVANKLTADYVGVVLSTNIFMFPCVNIWCLKHICFCCVWLWNLVTHSEGRMRAGPMGVRVKPPHKGPKLLWARGGGCARDAGEHFWLITIFVKLRVVAERSQTLEGSPQAVFWRPCYAVALRKMGKDEKNLQRNLVVHIVNWICDRMQWTW